MKGYRLQYIISIAAAVIMSIAAVILMNRLLDSSVNPSGIDHNGSLIVERAAELTDGSGYSDKAQARIDAGLMTVGDYVIRSMTSPSYLSDNITDERFASDLCYVITGDHNDPLADDILEDLGSSSRKYVIDEYLSQEDNCYSASAAVP